MITSGAGKTVQLIMALGLKTTRKEALMNFSNIGFPTTNKTGRLLRNGWLVEMNGHYPW